MLTNEHLSRQSDILPSAVLGEPITIIGQGAVGSWTTLALAKMGFCNLTTFDHDKFDTVNLNSQFCRLRDIGQFKSEAVAAMVMEFTGVQVRYNTQRYESGIFPGIVISAVDSMAVRKRIWEQAKLSPFTRAVIDPRMAGQACQAYVMRPSEGVDRLDYEKTLYGDSEALQERCTEKAIIYTSNLLSGLVCKAVKDLLTKPNHLRIAIWDIAGDQFEAYHREP